jgi:hypothetical protein
VLSTNGTVTSSGQNLEHVDMLANPPPPPCIAKGEYGTNIRELRLCSKFYSYSSYSVSLEKGFGVCIRRIFPRRSRTPRTSRAHTRPTHAGLPATSPMNPTPHHTRPKSAAHPCHGLIFISEIASIGATRGRDSWAVGEASHLRL